MALATKKGKVIKPPYAITMTIIGGSGWRKDRDLDNCWKPVLDLLQHINLIAEDNCQHITRLVVTYAQGDGRPAECHLTIGGA
jgi:Holliday junction resolvase RusA-like endonuclease